MVDDVDAGTEVDVVDVDVDVEVVLEVVVAVVLLVVATGAGVRPAGLVVVVALGTVSPGDRSGAVVVDEVLDDEVLVAVDAVVDGAGSGSDRRPSMRSRSRLSGEAVCTGSTGRPATAGFMAAAQIWAGKDPPVTRRPWTLVMGTILSG